MLALQNVPRIPGITPVMVKNVLPWQDLNSSTVNGENNYSIFIAWTVGLSGIRCATCLWAHCELLLNSCFWIGLWREVVLGLGREKKLQKASGWSPGIYGFRRLKASEIYLFTLGCS